MNIDVLRFLAFPDAATGAHFTRQGDARGQFKGDASDIITPIDPESGFGQWKHIKNSQGWPWDLRLYDNSFVYDWITEGQNGWSTDPNIGPKSFKKFIQNHTATDGSLKDGVAMFPRMVNTVRNNSMQVTLAVDSSYATFEGCNQTKISKLGQMIHTLEGPFQINHGGDVGTQPTLIHKYFWTDEKSTGEKVPTLEENYYALDFGWISWKLQRLNASTGFYEIINETIEPLIFAVPSVKIVFPCF